MKPGSKHYWIVGGVRKLKPGEAYVATHGAEFECHPESFRGVVYEAAKAKGAGWKGTVAVVGNQVFYSFYKDTDYMRPNMPALPLVRKARGES